MNDAGTFIFGLIVGLLAGFTVAWLLIHKICDHFLKYERDKVEDERRRADTYKRIANELRERMDWPEVIG
jgi:hypothetical protein